MAFSPPVLVIHGGAGLTARSRAEMTPEANIAYRAGLEVALLAGHKVLRTGGSSLDAVIAAIETLEDDPLFNAGKGAVFTHDGKIELDAAIMDGKTGMAGAVAGVTTVRHPIAAAKRVMEQTPHVLLIGKGAERFAAEQGLEIVDPSYFFTQDRWDQLQAAIARDEVVLDHEGEAPRSADAKARGAKLADTIGTVGAVALDRDGNLAAGTSTGGMTNKRYGRVGDSPIIGAGTYADNGTAAVSGTGTGEYFMRGALAYDISARMRYLRQPLDAAVHGAIHAALETKGGSGGVIALDARGNVSFGFNSEGMFRGSIREDGKPSTAVFED
jgi:L-asparaginase / beta-aspartyl-peptidase